MWSLRMEFNLYVYFGCLPVFQYFVLAYFELHITQLYKRHFVFSQAGGSLQDANDDNSSSSNNNYKDKNKNNNIDNNVTWITPAHNYHRPYHHNQQPVLFRHQHNHIRHHHVHHWGPFFEEDGKNASEGGQLALEVPLGGSVHLNCRVGMLHDKTVSTGAISYNLSGVKKHRTNLR